MTIYTLVLKQLMLEHLNKLSHKLVEQSKSFAHSHKLSLDQKQAILRLSHDVSNFFFNENNDMQATETFKNRLCAARSEISDIRTTHDVNPEEGATMGCLNNLIFRIDNLYNKLKAFTVPSSDGSGAVFNFLNMQNQDTPDYRVYFHLCYYFGEEIFAPTSGIDITIRSQKERKVIERLQELNELVTQHPEYNFDQNKKRTLKVLQDLISDNKEVVHAVAEKLYLPSVTVLSVFSVKPPTKLFAPGEGRLGEICHLALREINKLKEEHLENNKVSSLTFSNEDLLEERQKNEEERERSASLEST